MKSLMVLEIGPPGYPLYAAAAHGAGPVDGKTVVMVLLLAALCVVYWKVTLRFVAIAFITLLIGGALMAVRILHGG